MSTTTYLTFVIAGDEYGVAIDHVREIVRYGAPTRLPGAPEPVRGVTNLRGSVIPIVDLAVKFRLGHCTPGPMTCFVILELDGPGGRKRIGIIADEVVRVLEVHAGDIEMPPSFGTPISPEALIGLLREDSRFKLLLDIERVLATLDLEAAMAGEQAASSPVETK